MRRFDGHELLKAIDGEDLCVARRLAGQLIAEYEALDTERRRFDPDEVDARTYRDLYFESEARRLKAAMDAEPPYIVAELGCNHCGSEKKALEMVDVAASCGVDAVKLQFRDVWDSYPREWADRVYNGEDSYGATYLEHRRALELEPEAYRRIVRHAHGLGLECGASIWDANSLKTVCLCHDHETDKGLDWLKAPSACITSGRPADTDDEGVGKLDPGVMGSLEYAARQWGFPIVISLGMSTPEEIERAVDGYTWPDKEKLTLLHCVSAYPLYDEQAHLSTIDLNRSLWGHRARIGVSGHWIGIHLDSFAFGRYNIEFLERHFTLDHRDKGTDHRASLEPRGLSMLVRNLKSCGSAIGERGHFVRECEENARRKLRGS